MENLRDKYCAEILRTITDYNERKNAPLSKENILEAVNKVISEEESDSHNVTADTFSHTSNTRKENGNVILASEKLDKLDELAETLKYLTINDAEYYVSNLANPNDEKCDPTSNLKTVIHTSDKKKIKVKDTGDRILKKN